MRVMLRVNVRVNECDVMYKISYVCVMLNVIVCVNVSASRSIFICVLCWMLMYVLNYMLFCGMVNYVCVMINVNVCVNVLVVMFNDK